MLLFYVDEFGDHSMTTSKDDASKLKPGTSDWFVLAAVGIRDSSRAPLAQELHDLKIRHFGADIDKYAWGDSEIKGRYLFRVSRSVASGNVLTQPAFFAAIDSKQRVNNLIADLEGLLGRFRPVVLGVCVDKKSLLTHPSPQHPLGAAYTYLQQRVALTMERLHAGEGAILVADQQTEHESHFRAGMMNQARDELTKPLPKKPNFNLVMDKPLWIDTALSTWDREILQLADIAAYSVGKWALGRCAPEHPCYLWRALRPLFASGWTRRNGAESAVGGGLAIYPKPREGYPSVKQNRR